MKVLLIGNYPPDRQESMQRFAATLETELRARGHRVQLLRPRARLNRAGAPPVGRAKWLGYLDKFVIFPALLKRAARRADIVHICDHSNAMYVRHLAGKPLLLTCNDVLAIRSALGLEPSNPTGPTGRILQNLILRGLRRAPHVACISNNTREQLLEVCPRSPATTSVIYMGQNYAYAPMPTAQADAMIGSYFGDEISPYILHVGGNQWYKNREGVLAIYRQLRAQMGDATPRLVMVGPTFTGAMEEYCAQHDLNDVVRIEGATNEELRALYSRRRGFGLSVVGRGFRLAHRRGAGVRDARADHRLTADERHRRSRRAAVRSAGRGGRCPTVARTFERGARRARGARRSGTGERRALHGGAHDRKARAALPANHVRLSASSARLSPIMRILNVTTSTDPAGGGVIENIVQIGHYLRRDHLYEIASLDAPDAPWLADFSLPVHALGPAKSSYAYAPRLLAWLRRNRRNYDAVIVHGLWQYGGRATWKALRNTSTPYFVFPHGMLDPWFKHTYPVKHLKKALYWPWGEFRVLRDARAVCFTCEEERVLARQSFRLYRARETVVSFGTSAPPADADAQRAAFFGQFPQLRDKKIVLFLSRIHVKKGADLLIEAFARVAPRDPNLHLVMAGPDQQGLQAELEQQAQKLGIAPRITWTGMLAGEMKWGAFRAASAFALPSHQENFGIVVAEALACGAPVLISDKVNIWREIAADNVGWVAPDTLEGTLSNLENWSNAPATEIEAMRSRAVDCFRQRFEIGGAARSLLKVIERELKRG